MTGFLLQQLNSLYNSTPTLIDDFAFDDFTIGGAIIGAGGALLLGYYAKKCYGKEPISLKDGATCTLFTAIEGLKYGLTFDALWYTGKLVASNLWAAKP